MRMRTIYNKLKSRLHKWWIALLVFLGILTGAIAVPVGFTWENPTQYTDGSAYDPAVDQAFTAIYCGVDPNTFVPATESAPQTLTPNSIIDGDATAGSVDLVPGTRLCFATVTDIHGTESDPSNVITRIVERFQPEAPVLQ